MDKASCEISQMPWQWHVSCKPNTQTLKLLKLNYRKQGAYYIDLTYPHFSTHCSMCWNKMLYICWSLRFVANSNLYMHTHLCVFYMYDNCIIIKRYVFVGLVNFKIFSKFQYTHRYTHLCIFYTCDDCIIRYIKNMCIPCIIAFF